MKQTAVEWYAQQLGVTTGTMLERALEMEKEQIIDAWVDGDNSDCLSEQDSSDFAEQYYNETFNAKE